MDDKNKKTLIKIEFEQLFSCYRKPLHEKIQSTYDLPPYDIVVGLIMNIINSDKYKPINVSIQGENKGKTINDNLLTRYKTKGEKTGALYGVEELSNVKTIIHVDVLGNEELFNDILNGLDNLRLPFMGRANDIAQLNDVGVVEAEECDMEELDRPFKLKHNIWIPRQQCTEDCTGILEPVYKTYTLRNDRKNWDKCLMAKVVEKGTRLREGEFLIDNEGDLVVLA